MLPEVSKTMFAVFSVSEVSDSGKQDIQLFCRQDQINAATYFKRKQAIYWLKHPHRMEILKRLKHTILFWFHNIRQTDTRHNECQHI